jgi:hypothetical protein
LSSAWESACRDALKRLPREVDLPLTALLHVYAFPAVARALVPDPKVAQDAVDDLHLQWDIHDLWKKFKFLR